MRKWRFLPIILAVALSTVIFPVTALANEDDPEAGTPIAPEEDTAQSPDCGEDTEPPTDGDPDVPPDDGLGDIPDGLLDWLFSGGRRHRDAPDPWGQPDSGG